MGVFFWYFLTKTSNLFARRLAEFRPPRRSSFCRMLLSTNSSTSRRHQTSSFTSAPTNSSTASTTRRTSQTSGLLPVPPSLLRQRTPCILQPSQPRSAAGQNLDWEVEATGYSRRPSHHQPPTHQIHTSQPQRHRTSLRRSRSQTWEGRHQTATTQQSTNNKNLESTTPSPHRLSRTSLQLCVGSRVRLETPPKEVTPHSRPPPATTGVHNRIRRQNSSMVASSGIYRFNLRFIRTCPQQPQRRSLSPTRRRRPSNDNEQTPQKNPRVRSTHSLRSRRPIFHRHRQLPSLPNRHPSPTRRRSARHHPRRSSRREDIHLSTRWSSSTLRSSDNANPQQPLRTKNRLLLAEKKMATQQRRPFSDRECVASSPTFRLSSWRRPAQRRRRTSTRPHLLQRVHSRRLHQTPRVSCQPPRSPRRCEIFLHQVLKLSSVK